MFKLAWRNVWRNKRRSLLTLASIGFGLAALLFGQSLIKGLQKQIVQMATQSFTGHIRIQAQGAQDRKIPELMIEKPESIRKILEKGFTGVEMFQERTAFTGLVSSPKTSKGVLVVGVQPERDARMMRMASYLVQGNYLSQSPPRSIYMGDKLVRELDLRLGEKVVMMGQTTDGSLGAEAFRLSGVFHSGSQSFDGQIVYVRLRDAQRLLVAGDRISSFVIRVADVDALEEVRSRLVETVPRGLN